ncbi:MAG: hypothetical protein QW291_09020 [Thermofilaceae archaeon]
MGSRISLGGEWALLKLESGELLSVRRPHGCYATEVAERGAYCAELFSEEAGRYLKTETYAMSHR